jgi:hypothetical protein
LLAWGLSSTCQCTLTMSRVGEMAETKSKESKAEITTVASESVGGSGGERPPTLPREAALPEKDKGTGKERPARIESAAVEFIRADLELLEAEAKTSGGTSSMSEAARLQDIIREYDKTGVVPSDALVRMRRALRSPDLSSGAAHPGDSSGSPAPTTAPTPASGTAATKRDARYFLSSVGMASVQGKPADLTDFDFVLLSLHEFRAVSEHTSISASELAHMCLQTADRYEKSLTKSAEDPIFMESLHVEKAIRKQITRGVERRRKIAPMLQPMLDGLVATGYLKIVVSFSSLLLPSHPSPLTPCRNGPERTIRGKQ